MAFKLIVILTICLSPVLTVAQVELSWAKAFGGTNPDELHDVLLTPDGNYFVIGNSSSYDGDCFGNHGQSDYFALKLNTNGGIIWKKLLGGGAQDIAYSAQLTPDGGFIIDGFADSNSGNVVGNHGELDAWIIKLDANGNLVWQHCYGGTKYDEAYNILALKDGGHIFVGYSESDDGDLTMNHGFYDAWIVKIDINGEIEWQRSYGGSSDDRAVNVLPLEDGGYMVMGITASFDGNVLVNHGGFDYWLLRLNFDGKILWQKSYGGASIDVGSGLLPARDGGFYISGQAYSLDGQVSANHGLSDVWVLKIDSEGEIIWKRCYGGSNLDDPGEMIYAKDSTLILCGSAASTDGDVIGNDGGYDFWIMNLDLDGNILWQKTYGGSGPETGLGICQTVDGGFIAVGNATSHDGDVSGVHGDYPDCWVVKLSPSSSITHTPQQPELQISPNPAAEKIAFNIPAKGIDYQGEIIDVSGRVILRKPIEGTPERPEWDISALPSGLYFLRISNPSGESCFGRFLKE